MSIRNRTLGRVDVNGHNLTQVIKISDGADPAGRKYVDGRWQYAVAICPTSEFQDVDMALANTQHIVACWNACMGLDGGSLRPGVLYDALAHIQGLVKILDGVKDSVPLTEGQINEIEIARAVAGVALSHNHKRTKSVRGMATEVYNQTGGDNE